MAKKRAASADRAERVGTKTIEELRAYKERVLAISGSLDAIIKEMGELSMQEAKLDGINRFDRALKLQFQFTDDLDIALRRERRDREM